jgi:hypothetical protein
MLTMSVEDYRSAPELDDEIARLGYTAVQGWPDHTPVDAGLVRSLLRPAGMTATTLVVQRDADGAMIGIGAVRWPATLDEPGRFWGPIVSPEWRGRGIGAAILRATTDLLVTHAGMRLRTTEIPESRTEGYLIFERAGWRPDARAMLLERDLTQLPGELTGAASAVAVRAIRFGDYVAPQLAELVAVNCPELGAAAARDTFARWTADARYRPGGLLLAEAGDRLIGASMVYATRQAERELPLTPRSAALRSVPGSPLCTSQGGAGLPTARPRVGTSVDDEPNEAHRAPTGGYERRRRTERGASGVSHHRARPHRRRTGRGPHGTRGRLAQRRQGRGCRRRPVHHDGRGPGHNAAGCRLP